jgi:hypothetical protein
MMFFKGIFILVGLIVITLGINWLMHRMHDYKELHQPKVVQEGLWIPAEWIISLANQMTSLVGSITSMTNLLTMLALYATVLSLLGNISVGIFNHFLCGTKFFGVGFANGIQAAGIIFKCFVEKLGSIVTGDCLRFYVVDTIFGLIHFIVSAVLSILWSITGVDLQPLITLGWNVTVVPLDSFIYALTGHNITKWSDATITRCYQCSAEFAPNGDPARKKNYNLTLLEWYKVLECSIDEMKEGTYKMVTSVVPSRKWGAWAEGNHLDGADDDPPFTM